MRGFLLLAVLLVLCCPQLASAQAPSVGGVEAGTLGATPYVSISGGVARTPAQRASDICNVLNVTTATPADPTGVLDSSTAVNACAATGKAVYAPTGSYRINGQINLSAGQVLYGDGDHLTFLTMDQSLSSAANGVIALTGSETSSPYIHDIAFIFAQPSDTVTTAVGSAAAGLSTFTIASAVGVVSGNYVLDTTTGGVIPAFTTATVSGTTVTLSTPLTGGGIVNGDTIHFGPTRAQFATLASNCTSAAGGTGCQYPPAIYTATSTRPRIQNVHIEGAWQCINTTGNVVPWLTNIECGALNTGWLEDGAQDFVHVKGWHNWPYGSFSSSKTALGQIYRDGSTIGWQVGRVDGLNAEDITMFVANFVATSNAANSVSPWTISNLMLDGNAGLSVAGGAVQISNMYQTGSSTVSLCPITVTGGRLSINKSTLTSAGTTNSFCVTGGTFKVADSFIVVANSSVTSFFQTAGTLDLEGNYFSAPATTTGTLINSTGGATVLIGNSAHAGTSGPAISITTDSAANFVVANGFGPYSIAVPTGSVAGVYQTGNFGLYAPSNDATSVGIGTNALSRLTTTAGSYHDVALGVGALAGVMTTAAAADTGIGWDACNAVTTGNNNTCVGAKAGFLLTTGVGNSALGVTALATAAGANNNTAMGSTALNLATGASNTGVGSSALALVAAGASNTAVGINAGNKITSGGSNLVLGPSVASTTLATGSSNILIGTSASTDAAAAATSNEINIGGLLFWNAASLAAPTVSACGTQTIDAKANDRSGTVNITAGTPASCTITFAATYASWNHCRVTSQSVNASFAYSYSLSVITVTGSALAGKVDYDCDGV